MIFDQPYLVMLCALALTIVVEGIAILIIKRKKEYLGYSVLVNLITNPVVNLIILIVNSIWGIWNIWFFSGDYISPYIIVLEIIVVLVEARCYRGMTGMAMKKALGLSLVLNALSFFVGIAAEYIYWEFIW
ncbi:MAG: hypothetical protein II113_02040 [Firmicutes bacterium]|nr:hypothetical protein [Bacillota bacterium]